MYKVLYVLLENTLVCVSVSVSERVSSLQQKGTFIVSTEKVHVTFKFSVFMYKGDFV